MNPRDIAGERKKKKKKKKNVLDGWLLATKNTRSMHTSTKTECDYLYGWIKTSLEMVTPWVVTGNAEEENPLNSLCNSSQSRFYGMLLMLYMKNAYIACALDYFVGKTKNKEKQ